MDEPKSDREPPPPHLIAEKIVLLRGHKVLLDQDVAALYEIETRVLLQAVKRNPGRFPDDFMFRLGNQELAILRSQSVISSWGGRRYAPYAFTEQGVAMLSSVLSSPRAIAVNIQIIRTFVRMREILADNLALARKLEALEKKYDTQFKVVFDAIREMMTPKPARARPIGFVRPKEEKDDPPTSVSDVYCRYAKSEEEIVG